MAYGSALTRALTQPTRTAASGKAAPATGSAGPWRRGRVRTGCNRHRLRRGSQPVFCSLFLLGAPSAGMGSLSPGLSWPALALGKMHTMGPLFPDKFNPSCHQMRQDNGRGRVWRSQRTGDTCPYPAPTALCADTPHTRREPGPYPPTEVITRNSVSPSLCCSPQNRRWAYSLGPLALAGHC